jgi:hypothetical protein
MHGKVSGRMVSGPLMGTEMRALVILRDAGGGAGNLDNIVLLPK